jgi:hypothetical protein
MMLDTPTLTRTYTHPHPHTPPPSLLTSTHSRTYKVLHELKYVTRGVDDLVRSETKLMARVEAHTHIHTNIHILAHTHKRTRSHI